MPFLTLGNFPILILSEFQWEESRDSSIHSPCVLTTLSQVFIPLEAAFLINPDLSADSLFAFVNFLCSPAIQVCYHILLLQNSALTLWMWLLYSLSILIMFLKALRLPLCYLFTVVRRSTDGATFWEMHPQGISLCEHRGVRAHTQTQTV